MVSILPLVADGVVVRRGGQRLIGPVSARIEGPGITVILGPNGSGKTTLLRAFHGLERPRQGRVDWAVSTHTARTAQAFVFQRPILMRRTVQSNIAYPLLLAGAKRAAAFALADQAARDVGLAEHLLQRASDLSGGEAQKMALARALIREPQVLFLDEPCANLDGKSIHEIEAVLRAARDRNVRIVMSTHNIAQARRLADQILFLNGGLLLEDAPAAEFFVNPATPEAKAHINGDLLP